MSRSEAAFVIDASVFVADARIPEPSHTDANRLLETLASRGCVLHAPAIVLSEIAAALACGVGDPVLAREAVEMYRQWPGVQLSPVDETLASLAAEVAAKHRIRGCDAVYVALAYTQQAVLVTLDRQQQERTPQTIPARTPAQALAEWFRK